MALRFEWDAAKARANLSKHEVSFAEAITAFGDPLARIFEDLDRSENERRELLIGHSDRQRLLVVCFAETSRGVRIISARTATRRERRDDEENA